MIVFYLSTPMHGLNVECGMGDLNLIEKVMFLSLRG
jgi:hypothetical protein